MPFSSHNPNLHRRFVPGLLTLAASIFLRPLLIPFRRAGASRGELTVFASYMVGDLYMALPALKKIAAARPARILCRPDCVGLLAMEGLPAEAFPNPFREKGLSGFSANWKAALALRGKPGDALDLDADPRTAFWMRVAGLRAISYRRAYGALFDETFTLPEPSVHQADRDLRVVEEYLRRYPLSGSRGSARATAGYAPFAAHGTVETARDAASDAPWILSVWTRKPPKNWSLENWEAFLERAFAAGIPVRILAAPDGDAEFRAFRARWEARWGERWAALQETRQEATQHARREASSKARQETRAPSPLFLEGSLEDIARAVRDAAGVAATDNFLGHMGGYYGKPVLWINRVSPTAQVIPRGPRTLEVRSDDPARPDSPEVDAVWRGFESLQG